MQAFHTPKYTGCFMDTAQPERGHESTPTRQGGSGKYPCLMHAQKLHKHGAHAPMPENSLGDDISSTLRDVSGVHSSPISIHSIPLIARNAGPLEGSHDCHYPAGSQGQHGPPISVRYEVGIGAVHDPNDPGIAGPFDQKLSIFDGCI